TDPRCVGPNLGVEISLAAAGNPRPPVSGKIDPELRPYTETGGAGRPRGRRKEIPVTAGRYPGQVDSGGATDDEPLPAAAVRSPTEERNPASTDIDTLDAAGVVHTILAIDADVAAAVAARSTEITALVEHGVGTMRAGGRVVYVGAGTSGRLAV